MFNLFAKDRRPNWYPGATIMRDRWGTALNTKMAAREFRPVADAPDSTINHMRWSLGLM
jgi:hypothetical protein